MKKLMPLVLLTSLSIHAQTLEVRASKVTCDELQRTLAENGSLIIVKKILLFKDKTFVRHSVTCSGDEYKKTFTFKTLDEKRCPVGEVCRYIPSTPDDSGSSGSDYGGSSDWGSGWGSGGGSSYEPPSSSDRGTRYDPPSSSDRGSRYDPPSTGERGSRYCPSC